MAVTAYHGWELNFTVGYIAQDPAFTGTASISATQARTGTYSARCNPASGAQGYWITAAIGTSSYGHFGLYVATLPSLDRIILGSTSAGMINVRLTSAGALAIYLSTTLIGTSSAAFASPGWHWVGVRNVTGTSVVFLQIDGVNEVTGTATVSATCEPLGCIGSEASAIDIYFDDYIIDNAGFLSPSKVDIALPIGTTANTGVTDANGGTTNIWEGVNNTPPAGVASANEAANPNASIKFPASTVASYEVTLESYATLGIAAGDTILAVQSTIRHGEDITTGTKNGTLSAVTNPTISDSLAFTFGLDAGAHGADSTSSLTWATKFGTLTTSPSVTLGTSPTLTITRASESRVGCVDLMGLWVVWTPAAVVARVPRFSPYPQLLAH